MLLFECNNVLYHTLKEDHGLTQSTRSKTTHHPPDRAVRALTQQLEGLRKLKGRTYKDADAEETEWAHLTQSIIEDTFGNPSSELSKFYSARSAGFYSTMGTSPQQYQENFQLRIQEYEALLRALTSALRLQLPEEEIKGVYEPGDEYAFYPDLSALVLRASHDVFIVDAYLDEQLFNLYVSEVPAGTSVRILSNKIGANVETVARMYSKSRPLAVRSSADIHDRAIFLDQQGWFTGQSIKDAARKKQTYIIELDEPMLSASRDIHNAIWKAAAVII